METDVYPSLSLLHKGATQDGLGCLHDPSCNHVWTSSKISPWNHKKVIVNHHLVKLPFQSTTMFLAYLPAFSWCSWCQAEGNCRVKIGSSGSVLTHHRGHSWLDIGPACNSKTFFVILYGRNVQNISRVAVLKNIEPIYDNKLLGIDK